MKTTCYTTIFIDHEVIVNNITATVQGIPLREIINLNAISMAYSLHCVCDLPFIGITVVIQI